MPSFGTQIPSIRRNASSQSAAADDVEPVAGLASSPSVSEDVIKNFDPIKNSKLRKEKLPSSR